MKKRFYVFSMLAAGMLFAGCSDDLEGGQDGPNVVEGVTGYVRIALNLPTDGMSTRSNNDVFADGLPVEYQVNNGIIAYFSGAKDGGTDETATFVRAYNLGDLTGWSMVGEDDDQITSRRVVVQEAPVVGTDNQLYALVILNPNSVVSVVNSGDLQLKGLEPFQAGGAANLGNIRDFLTNQTVDDYIKTGTGKDEKPSSFLMTNAPLANKPIGDGLVVHTLVPVTVYNTQAEAEGAKKSDEIYVERAVAKVTLSGFKYENNAYTMAVTPGAGNVYNGDKVTLTGWILNTTNNSTALVRNVTDYKTWNTTDYNTDGSTNRFFGGSPVATDTYRVYWAIDDNYGNETEKSDFTIYEEDTSLDWNENTEDKSNDESYPLYCLENTMSMDEAAGDDDVITSVLLRTTYNFGNSETAEDFFIVTNTPMKKQDFLDYVNERMGYDGNSGGTKLTEVYGDGKIVDTAEEVKTLFNLSGDGATTQAEAILAKVGTIKYYKNGSTYYYAARIKHFGDSYRTLDPRNPNIAGKTEGNCLGYYGVVRNNWYEITIKSISGPGEPEKRTQDVEL